MNVRIFVGALVMGALMALAVLAGGIVAQSTSASAPPASNTSIQASQADQTTQAATPAPTTAPAAPQPGEPGKRGPMGRGEFRFGGPGPEFGGPDFGFGGPGFGGPGEFGFGPRGGGPLDSADGANRVISATNSLITLVKGDLDYAKGKMDTATVQDWLTRADGLAKDAQTASDNKDYERAVETAQAARGLAMAADTLMQQALGADKLPSYNQRPFPGKFHNGNGTPPTPPDMTQAQASRVLAGYYNSIIAQQAVVKNAFGKSDASTYLTAAEDTYKKAYDSYQAGKYNDVRNSVMVGRMLLGVANDLLRASNATTNPDTPVQVPAPTFNN